jgi:hypothetical protein
VPVLGEAEVAFSAELAIRVTSSRAHHSSRETRARDHDRDDRVLMAPVVGQANDVPPSAISPPNASGAFELAKQ